MRKNPPNKSLQRTRPRVSRAVWPLEVPSRGACQIASEDGEIRFVERTADLIMHKGFRISASEVEAVLQDHPTVVAACVVGVSDEVVGERVKAIVVLKEGVRGTSGGELRAFCRERLASYKVPRYVEFRDMLPKG